MILKKNKFFHSLLLLFSFLIVASAQPDWSRLACILASSVGYALFWHALLQFKSRKLRLAVALIWFALVSLIHLNWFFSDRYVGPYIYPFLALLVTGLGVQFALISLFLRPERAEKWISLLGISGGWALGEWSRLFFLSGYTFDPVGLSLTATTVGLQWASVGGVFGLSFWVFFTNLVALKCLRSFSWKNSLGWIAVASLPYIFGVLHITYHSKKMASDPSPSLSVLLVQVALTPEQKYSSPLIEQWERTLKMLKPYISSSVDLIVFPEGFVPYGTHTLLYPKSRVVKSFDLCFGEGISFPEIEAPHVPNLYWAEVIANTFSAPLIIGLEDVEGAQAYNAAFLIQPHNQKLSRYEKRVLVPMGEYIPFEWSKKILSKYGILDSYTPGKEATVFQTDRFSAGISICYEEMFGHLMWENLGKGAQMHINLSNDVWYPKSRLPMIHFCHGRLRSVEGGIPQLRACNTGVTCGIDALGRMTDSLPYESADDEAPAAILPVSLPLYHFKTIYSLWGDRPIIYLSSLLFSWLCVARTIRRKQFTLNDLDNYHLQEN